MKRSWIKTLAANMALGCAIAQTALGSSLAFSTVALGLYSSHPHAHASAFELDGDHFDLVLSHEAVEVHEGERDGSARDHDHLVSVGHGDHVIHMSGADSVNAAHRRANAYAAPVLGPLPAPPVVAAPLRSRHASHEPHALGVARLRTVVLRL